ncbi:hypothetical protein SprV_0602085400 [Sparganum proliferum]
MSYQVNAAHSVATAAENKVFGKTHNKRHFLGGRRSHRFHVARRPGLRWLRVTPLSLSSDVDKPSTGRLRFRGSGGKRQHFFSRGCPNDTLLVDIKGPPGATFKVRLSTRTSPLHRIYGYPQVPPDHKVHVCLVDERQEKEGRTVTELEINWPSAEHTEDQKMIYCVAINDRENLLQQCSAATRLHPQAQKDHRFLLRSAIFSKTEVFRPEPTKHYVYACTNSTEMRVTLPDPLARRLKMLEAGGELFINIYAMNQDSQLSSPYTAVVLGRHFPLDYCNSPQRARKAPMPADDGLSTQFTAHSLRWHTDLDFDLPVSNLQLLFQPCLLGERPYLVQVYQQSPIHKQRENFGAPVCQLVVENSRAVQLCRAISSGSYRIRVSETSSSNNSLNSSSLPNTTVSFFASQRIGRIFFVSPDLNPLPLWPRHAIIEPLLSYIVEKVPKNIPLLEKNCSNETSDSGAETASNGVYWSLVEVRNASGMGPTQISEGFFFNVSCQHQRLSLILAVHPEQQRLWIYTLPVPKTMTPALRNGLFCEMQKKTDYCHLTAHSMLGWSGHALHTQHILTSSGERWIEVDLPFAYTAHGPTYVLVSVYSARQTDLTGEHRQLIGQRLVNACSLVYDRCASHRRKNRCF